MKTTEETNAILTQVAYYDHRTIDPKTLDQWHHALIRLTIEDAFDAIHTHFERCNQAHGTTLIAGHVLEHANTARRERETTERQLRDRQRNEAVFGSIHDHRADWEREAATTAYQAGRAHLDAILEQRRGPTDTETSHP